MIIVGIVLSVVGIGFFCWLLFTLAVYALPFFAGVTAGLAAFHSGSGVIGAVIVAMVAGAVTLVVGQIAFAAVRSVPVRAAIALLFAAPAAIAAMIIGGTAWARMTLLAAPIVGQGIATGSAGLPLASATRDG